MPDKLTDSEIVKDLNEAEDLENVLLYCKNPNKEVMIPIKITDIRDLINRLQSKNKMLQERNIILRGLVDTQKAEIESLKYLNNANVSSAISLRYELGEAKAEAYKDCIEKVKRELAPSVVNVPDMYEILDNLLEELVGEQCVMQN